MASTQQQSRSPFVVMLEVIIEPHTRNNINNSLGYASNEERKYFHHTRTFSYVVVINIKTSVQEKKEKKRTGARDGMGSNIYIIVYTWVE